MKIRRVEAELFRADGQTDRQTDMTKLRVAFCIFPKAPKKGKAEKGGVKWARIKGEEEDNEEEKEE